MTFDHLSPRARLVAEQDITARVDYLRKTPVLPLKPLDDVAVWIGKEIAGKTPPHKPITILLIPCGMGASGMVQRVIASYPPHPHSDQRILRHPAVLAHLPASGTLREIGAEICSVVGAPVHCIGGTQPNAIGWLNLLHRIGTRMLCFDDLHALNRFPKTQQGAVLNLIRTAVSRFQIRVSLICPPQMRPLIMDDPQLAGRAQLVEILPFKATDPAFDGFLDAFHQWCPLRRSSDLRDDQSLRKALIRRTNGITRNLMDVLVRLAAYAIYSAEEWITYDLWREYFSRAEYD